jgi:hypothetical protein
MSHYVVEGLRDDGKPVCIRTGYDRPLDYVFMSIEIGGEIVYSDMDDPQGYGQQDIAYYRGVLRQFRLALPEEVFDIVRCDQTERKGNASCSFELAPFTAEVRG